MFAGIFIGIGLGVTDRLSPTMTFVPGTESTRAEDLAEAEFGPGTLVPILLTGPRAQLDRQGPVLVYELRSRPDTRVLSAWDAGEAGAALRPSRTEAMVLASVARSNEAMVDGIQADIDSTVDTHTWGAVESHISGTPTLDRAIEDEALQTTRTATLLALPILFLVLLVVLRAPLAALITTAFGGTVAFVGFGVMTVVGEAFDVDAIGIALTSLMGLAIGTGLALMIVVRFRREEAAVAGARGEAALAASATVGSAGRAVLIAGTGLFLSLFLASVIGPTENLHSVGTGGTVNALLATGAAVVVMPAVLTLLGPTMFAGSVGAPRLLSAPWKKLVGAESTVLRRAVVFGGAATLGLVALAIPALGIETGPVSPTFLPRDNEARRDLEAIQRAMGPGFPYAYNIVVVSDSGPITERRMLRKLDRFQAELARDKRVESVAGPGEFRAATSDLGTLETKLDESKALLRTAPKDLGKLEGGLGQAGAGAVLLQSGLEEAAAGAGKLAAGGGDAQSGAGRLREGLAAARAGSEKISGGLNTALSGANDLKAGAGEALAGAQKLSEGLGQTVALKEQLPVVQQMAQAAAAGQQAVASATQGAGAVNTQLQSALGALQSMTDGKNDPAYAQVEAALAQAQQSAGGLSSTLTGAQPSMDQVAGVSALVSGELGKLADGLTQLYDGSTRSREGWPGCATATRRLLPGSTSSPAGAGSSRTASRSSRTGRASCRPASASSAAARVSSAAGSRAPCRRWGSSAAGSG